MRERIFVFAAALLLLCGQQLVEGACGSARLPCRTPPCILTTTGQVNRTAWDAVISQQEGLAQAIINALTCSGLNPFNLCSGLNDNGRFCVLQNTDLGNCIAPPPTLTNTPQQQQTRILSLAVNSTCPPELAPKRGSSIGRVLCAAIMAQPDASLFRRLSFFWPAMQCLPAVLSNKALGFTTSDIQAVITAVSEDQGSAIRAATGFGSTLGATSTSNPIAGQTVQGILNTLTSQPRPARLQQLQTFVRTLNSQSNAESGRRDRRTQAAARSQNAFNPSPAVFAAADAMRPPSNMSEADVATLTGNAQLCASFGDNELRSISRRALCLPRNDNGSDPYSNLAVSQQTTIRELCAPSMPVRTMPPSIRSRATPENIATECPTALGDLLDYVESFSNMSSTVIDPQVFALQNCCDSILASGRYAALNATLITRLRICIRHIPLATILPLLNGQPAIDNYCRAMADGAHINSQTRPVLSFCLQNSTWLPSDLGILLSTLNSSDVSAMSTTLIQQGITTMAQSVSDKAARRALLDRFVSASSGWSNFTSDNFRAIDSLVTEINPTDLSAITASPTARSGMGTALPSITAALQDCQIKATLGTAAPANATDVSRTMATVVQAAISAVTDTASTSPRKKRQANVAPPRISCDVLSSLGSAIPNIDLSNLNSTVFTDCPSSLNVDGYNNTQLVIVANQARQSLGSPCLWSNTTIQQLGVIIVGLQPFNNFSCINMLGITSGTVPGKGFNALLGMPLPPLEQFQSMYSAWNIQRNPAGRLPNQPALPAPLTALVINSLGFIICGIPDPTVINSTELDKSIKMMGQLTCFPNVTLARLAGMALNMYGVLSAATITNLGTIIAGMNTTFFASLAASQIQAITPPAISLLPPSAVQTLTVNQLNAFTVQQALAFTPRQLTAMSPDGAKVINSKISGSTNTSTAAAGSGGQTTASVGSGNNMLTGVNGVTVASGNGFTANTFAGGNGNTVAGGNGFTAAGGSGNTFAGGNGVTVASGNGFTANTFAGGNGNTVAGGSGNTFAGGNGNTVTGAGIVTYVNGDNGNVIMTAAGNSGGSGSVTEADGSDDSVTSGGNGGGNGGNDVVAGTTVMPININQTVGSGVTLVAVVTGSSGGGSSGGESGPVPQAPVTLPPNIDPTNAYKYADQFSKTSATELTSRLTPAALTSAPVFSKLQENLQDMTDSQKNAIQSLVAQTLRGSATGAAFDPSLLAAVGSFMPASILNSLSPAQTLQVVQNSNFKASDADAVRDMGAKVGRALTDISNPDQLKESIASASKAIAGVKPTDFQTILGKATVDSKFLEAFHDAPMTSQQATMLFQKYQSDSKTDLSKSSASQVLEFVDSVPKSMLQAVPASVFSSVSSANSSTVLSLLSSISNSDSARRDNSDVPNAAANVLYDKLDKKALSTESLVSLANNGQLQIDGVKASGTKLCNVAQMADAHSSPAMAKQLYVQCKSVLGNLWSGTTDKYGRLSIGAPPADINATSDDAAFIAFGVANMCDNSQFLGSSAQLDAVVAKVKAHLDAKNDLASILSSIPCILPYLGQKYLSAVTDATKQAEICRTIACASCNLAPRSVIRDALEFCIKAKVPLSNMYCRNGGQCLLQALNAEDVAKYPCADVFKSIDSLAEGVVNCSTRAAIYACAKPLLNFTDPVSMAVTGSIVDQMSSSDLRAATNSLCGRVKAVGNAWNNWDQQARDRTEVGLTSVPSCGNRTALVSNLIAVDMSSTCTGLSRRKKRDAVSILTCTYVNSLTDSAITTLSASQLSTLTASDFPNCAYRLGRIDSFTSEQWTALANVAKQAFNGDVSQWTPAQITTAAGIVTGLPTSNVDNLKLSTLEAISAVGNNGLWSSDKLVAAFKNVIANYKSGNGSALTTADLRSMGEIACGASSQDISKISPAQFCGALQNLGRLELCEASQLQPAVTLVQSPSCLGSDVTTWSTGDISSLGIIIGGLSKTDIAKLSTAQIASISEKGIAAIPPTQFSGFTATQLGYFTTTQAAVISVSQFQSLSPDQQQAVNSKLSAIKSDIVRDPASGGTGNGNGGSGCGRLEVSMAATALMVGTTMAMFLMM